MFDDYYTVEDVAEMALLNVSTIRAHIKRGNLTAVKKFNVWLIEPYEANRFVEENRPVGRPRKDGK